MTDLRKLIENNPNIEYSLIDKVIECVELIINKYPIAYRNLYNNLETITIRYTNIEDRLRLKGIGADSCYNCEENLMLLNEEFVNSEDYKHILIHELLHVASFNEKNMGFESLYAKKGLSFNEGMTEHLKQEILNDNTKGFYIYSNDINNIMLLSAIIPIEKLTNLYFTDGLLGIIQEYLNQVGKENNLENLIINMDAEFDMRVRQDKFDNEYKDEYIKIFIDDISKMNFETDEQIISTIKLINDFIRCQYNTTTAPLSIKDSISNSINTIFSKSSIEKGITK